MPGELPELDRSAIAREAGALADAGRRLLESGFTPDGVRASLGAPPYLSIFDALMDAEAAAVASAPPMVRLLLGRDEVPEAEVIATLGAAGVDTLLRLGVLARRGDALGAEVAIAPLARPGLAPVLIAFERFDRHSTEWAVAPPDSATELVLHAARAGGGAWLDVGAGSGAIALLAARQGASTVIAADLNPRAAAFVDLGAALSGLAGRVVAVTSDLTASVPPGPYEVVTFVAPMLSRSAPGPRWRYAPEGVEILDRFLAELPAVLGGPDAEALLNVGLPADERPLLERLPSGTADLRALRIAVLVEGGHTYGLLWLARPRGFAWAAEQRFFLTVDSPVITRDALDAEIAGLEHRLASGR